MADLELRLQLRQQLGVGLGVDLLAQDPLGTGDGQRGDLLAQGFLGALRSGAASARRLRGPRQ
jgi:hypothetical protein